MKGKKIFPNKTASDIFFLDNISSYQKLTTPPKTNLKKNRETSILLKRKMQAPNYHRRNRSVDNSEQLFKEKIIKKLDNSNISKFRKNKDNISFMFNEKYYNKFVNKPSGKINTNIKLNTKSNNQITYEIVKTKKDNKIIDTQDIKNKFSRNGINIFKIHNCTSGLTSVDNDKISFNINENDIKNGKFIQLKNNLKRNGLEMKKKKTRYDKSNSQDIFCAKDKWDNKNFGGRDKRLSAEHAKQYIEKISKGVNKINSFTKNINLDLKYKNNIEKKVKKN